jgi:hypothetical protein
MGYPTAAKQRSQKQKGLKDECPGSVRVHEQRVSTVTDTGQPQSALLGMAVTQQLEIIFDTVNSSRKHPNLKKHPRVAWVLGCTTEVTVQYEGVAEGVGGRTVGQVQKDLFRRISGWTRTGELAGHYLFCCAANLGQILRLQPRESEDGGAEILEGAA